MKSYFSRPGKTSGLEDLKSLEKEFGDIKYRSGEESFNPFFITTIREIGLQNAFDSYTDAKKKNPNYPDFYLKISLIEDINLMELNYFKEIYDKVRVIKHYDQKENINNTEEKLTTSERMDAESKRCNYPKN